MSTSEVTRSDSNRSDNSQKPRVSFNRDVHIKRIAPHDRRLSSDFNTDDDYKGQSNRKFYSLPRNKHRKVNGEFDSFSLDRKSNKRRNYLEFPPPTKPPRTFVSSLESLPKAPTRHRRQKKNVNPKIRRSSSDATSLKSKAFGPITDKTSRNSTGKFTLNKSAKAETKEPIKEERIVDKLKQYIDEVDQELYRETGIRYKPPASKKDPIPVVIDVDKAEKISDGKTSKFSLGKTLKAWGNKFNRIPFTAKNVKKSLKRSLSSSIPKENDVGLPALNLQSGLSVSSPALQSRSESENDEMRSRKHHLQHPEGKNISKIIKQLSADNISHRPPMAKNVLVAPNSYVQHNNNRPFSYIKGLSSAELDFDKSLRNDEEINEIYIHKKTVQESPILPRYRLPTPVHMFDEEIVDNQSREEKKTSMSRSFVGHNSPENGISQNFAAVRSDITARRDLLELRNRRRGGSHQDNLSRLSSNKNYQNEDVLKSKIENQYQSSPEISHHKYENNSSVSSLNRNKVCRSDISTLISDPSNKISRNSHRDESEDEGFASGRITHDTNQTATKRNSFVKSKGLTTVPNYRSREHIADVKIKKTLKQNRNTGTSTEEESTADFNNCKEHKRYFGDTDSDNSKSKLNLPNSLVKKSFNEIPLTKKKRSFENRKPNSSLSPQLHKSIDKIGSQQSVGSVVYLHAPRVCDIPRKKGQLKSYELNTSVEDLSSTVSSQITPCVKTSSRSFSVLAPWKPNRVGKSKDIDYSQQSNKSYKSSEGSMLSSKSKNSLSETTKDNNKSGRKDRDVKKKSNESKNIFRSLSMSNDKGKPRWFRK